MDAALGIQRGPGSLGQAGESGGPTSLPGAEDAPMGSALTPGWTVELGYCSLPPSLCHPNCLAKGILFFYFFLPLQRNPKID